MIFATFKEYLTLSGLLSVLLLWSVPVGATKGPQDVSNTTHNFSATAPNTLNSYRAATEAEVCIFCHTPHGGSLDGALWNKGTVGYNGDISGAAYFTHYNSASLSSGAKGGGLSRNLGPESLLCMSCHDGTIAINRVMNVSNSTTPDPDEPDALINSSFGEAYMQGDPGAWIGSYPGMGGDITGGHLADDHPVSFDYTASYAVKSASLHLIDDVKSKGVRFFPAGGAGTQLECSSCHDPHVDYKTATQYTPFLITTNAASALCLTCHIL